METVSSDDRVIELATRSGKYRARLFHTDYEWNSPGMGWTNAGEGKWDLSDAAANPTVSNKDPFELEEERFQRQAEGARRRGVIIQRP